MVRFSWSKKTAGYSRLRMAAAVSAELEKQGRGLPNLGDDEIRDKLKLYKVNLNIPINSSTRPLLLKKIAQLEGLILTGEKSEEAPSPADKTPERASTTPTKGFYVLLGSASASSHLGESDNQEIFFSKADTLKAAKEISGVRFRKFDSHDEARAFVEQQKGAKDHIEDNASTKSSNPERANAYPSLKTPDLNKFRSLIEKNLPDQWLEAVWQNPLYLITQGDTPVILKPPTRYNALHCAVKSGSLAICRKLFEVLEGDQFWSMVYPMDSTEVRDKRRNHLIDLYLNTSDKGLQETPLHFASKYGHEDIVAYLLSFPSAADSNRPNRYGQTPSDLACSNDQDASASKKQRIRDLFTAPAVFYVPVLRAVDNSICPSLSSPCTLEQLEVRSTLDRKESLVTSSAMAGPMSLLQAKMFHKEWQSPSRSSERMEVKNVKRSDPDRGMERRGRHLAHQRKIPWKEKWDFLNCCCDLSKPDGLGRLESHLATLSLGPKLTPDSPTSNTDTQGHAVDASDDDLLAKMSSLSLQDLSFSTPKSSTVKKCVFITGPEPTKLDYDVLLAVQDCCIDGQLYPNITRWQALVRSFSEEEQKRWRTPTKPQLGHYSPFSQPSQSHEHSHSPLLYSTPKRHWTAGEHSPHPLAKQLFVSPSGTSKHQNF